ncbi:hypothetical protein LCGC14_1345140 [marine sediment metagenome]|uniref:Uncharacterized protein n=1 Tax=marine sediment metagenome TaxID=412755 RepID=A0A0F9KD84_9ZZZZ
MDELNQKIAEFAEFKEVIRAFSGKPNGYWRCPGETTLDGKHIIYESRLRFTDPELGIAYLFKWVVPKLEQNLSGFGYFELLKNWVFQIVWSGGNPALALCGAVEKLIDSQVPSEVK